MANLSSAFNQVTATIASGGSLSSAVCVGSGVPIAVRMPAAWTAADLTFQAALDPAGPWKELSGAQITVAAGAHVTMDGSLFAGAPFLKVRSGTAAVPVNQAADREIEIVARKDRPL